MARLLGALAALVALAAAPSLALAHEGNPDYRSTVRAVAPAVDGLEIRVANFDDNLSVVHRGPQTVVFMGYREEPYLRFSPDGLVEVNRRSPAHYLNDDRFADVAVPEQADPQAPPEWEPVARQGRYSFHDHRIHWMAEGVDPPAVRELEDRSQPTEVFDWEVPIRVGDAPSTVAGTLTWIGATGGGGLSPVVLGLLGVAVVASAAVSVIVRRRRDARDARRDGAAEAGEAW